MNRNARPAIAAFLVLGVLAGCATTGQPPDDPTETGEEVPLGKLLAEAEEALRAGDLDTAQVRFALAVERDPTNVDALYKLGVVHYEKRSFTVAEGLLRTALSVNPLHQGSREALGIVMLEQKRLDEAEKILTSALESRPDSWQVMNALGVINDMRSNHAEAQELFGAALFVRPRSAKLANNLGYSFYLAGDYDAAEKHFRDATRYDPEYVHAWSNLALVYSRTGRYRDSRAAFGKVVETHQAANNLGYLALLQDKPDVARRELESAIRLSPSYYEVANENLAALGSSGRTDADPRTSARATSPVPAAPPVSETSSAATRAGTSATGPRPIVSATAAPGTAVESRPEPAEVPPPAPPPSTAAAGTTPSLTLGPEEELEAEAPAVPPAERRRTARREAAPLLAFVGFEAESDADQALEGTVRRFQEAYDLEVDGQVGPRTARLLREVAVTQLQRKLLALGFEPGEADGSLGRRTREAIREFQREESLPVTGEPDAATLERLGLAVGRASEELNGDDLVDYSARG